MTTLAAGPALNAPTEKRGRASTVALVAVAIAAFGPYLPIPGVRTEQVAVYGLLLVGVVAARYLGARPIAAAGVLVAALLAVEALIAVIGATWPIANLSRYLPGSPLAGMDNLLLPLAVLTVVWMLADADVGRHLRAVCAVVVVAMCVNAALAYLSIGHDLSPLLAHFWDNSGARSVAEKAGQLGRYGGIFNQPAEAGVMYSIALLAAVYLFCNRPLLLAITGAVITLGGVLTVSKAFLLVGLPVGVYQALRSSGTRPGRRAALLTVALAGLLISQSDLAPRWAGSDYLRRLIMPAAGGDRAGLYTAGRLGESSTLQTVADQVLHNSPWFGFGAGGLAVPYDDAWVEALAVAGIAGVLIYTLVLVALVWAWIQRRHVVDPAWSRFAGGLVLVLTGASVGLPALTANRVATIAWLLLALLILTPVNDPPKPAAAMT